MRLWSLHPKYLDPQGLVALWRETLLAQAVLRGQTRGYRNHPQLDRFKRHSNPLATIGHYLKGIHEESIIRGYAFDESKIRMARKSVRLVVTTGQLDYEWKHLLLKLKTRDPVSYRKWRKTAIVEVHPLFDLRKGGVESWERLKHQHAVAV
jgi:hypothetical protein